MKLFNYEFIFRKVKKPVRSTGYTSRTWTKSEKATLLRFRNEGKTNKEIGLLLKRTEAAIFSMVHKIKKDKHV